MHLCISKEAACYDTIYSTRRLNVSSVDIRKMALITQQGYMGQMFPEIAYNIAVIAGITAPLRRL